jgi:hypothetical protein
MDIRRTVLVGLAALGMLAVSCSTDSQSAPPTTSSTIALPSSTPAAPPCALTPTEDLIKRVVTPGAQPDSLMIGDVDIVHCKPSVDTLKDSVPMGPGFCSQIARAADNPGYVVDVRPAPPLRKIIVQVGAGCT